ncbi:AraC family transcriptional regulator [Methylophaga sp.]|uniref:AraC family transcriptional regulator n=1 Tax=Methylophaga sp. TaxID=2024840 RepID=UPI003F69FAC4
MDKLSLILNRLSVTAGVFFSGEMCGLAHFDGTEQREGHIHLLSSGRIDVIAENGEVVTLDKPSLIFFPKPNVHRLRAKESDNATIVCASIKYGADTSNPLTNALPNMVTLSFEDDQYVEASVNGLFDEAFHHRDGKQLLMDRLIEIVIVHLLRNIMSQDSGYQGLLAGLANKQLAKVIIELHKSPGEAWTLDSMSQLAFMSRSKFADEFRRVVGQTPGDYLIDWRISVAQSELKKGKPVSVVANEVGYENSSALSKAFKRKTGLSPSAWLKSYLQP